MRLFLPLTLLATDLTSDEYQSAVNQHLNVIISVFMAQGLNLKLRKFLIAIFDVSLLKAC